MIFCIGNDRYSTDIYITGPHETTRIYVMGGKCMKYILAALEIYEKLQ